MVVKSLRLLQLDHPRALGLGLGGVIGSNLLGRRHLKRWFERVIIHDTRLAPPLGDLDDFVTSYVSLSTDNLRDRKSTRLNSSHVRISYAVFCLKNKTGRLVPHC